MWFFASSHTLQPEFPGLAARQRPRPVPVWLKTVTTSIDQNWLG